MTEECSVLGGHFALFMQVGLGFITFMVLIWKKVTEHGERTWFEFGLDSSKQLLGAGWLHITNMVCAIAFASELSGVDGCSWYASNIILDTTLGVLIEWSLLLGLKRMLQSKEDKNIALLLESGSYWSGVGPQRVFRMDSYLCQLGVWLAIVTLMKLFMVTFMRLLPWSVYLIDFFLRMFDRDRRMKLFMVMIVIPMMMNTFQFVITDNIIKKKPRQTGADELELHPKDMMYWEDEDLAVRSTQGDSCFLCTGTISKPKGAMSPKRNGRAVGSV